MPIRLENFVMVKRSIKVIKSQGTFRVKVIELEPPTGFTCAAEEIEVERMQDGSFLFMVLKFSAFMLNNLDLIPAKALIGASVEVSGVLIAFQSRSHLASLFPEGEFGLRYSTKDANNHCPESRFWRSKWAILFNSVQKIGHNLAVRLLLWYFWYLLSPCFECKAGFLELRREDSCWVTVPSSTIPGSDRDLLET